MSVLSERFHYGENGVIVGLNVEQAVQELREKGFSQIDSGIKINNKSVKYELYLVVNKIRGKKHLLLTALLDKKAIGFRDVMINPGNISWGNGCFGNRGERLSENLLALATSQLGLTAFKEKAHLQLSGVPRYEIRFCLENFSGSHSFLVDKKFRGNGLGRGMMFTVFEIIRELGAVEHVINVVEDGTRKRNAQGDETSFYENFTTNDGMYFHFKLSDEE